VTLTTPAPAGLADPKSEPPARLGWLDALRGFAALTVVCFHVSPLVLGTDRHLAIYRHIDFGKYGVLLFFLVSGYVIPMSLERHGSLRTFWVGRLLRIYPAYLATIALVTFLAVVGAGGFPAWVHTDPLTGVLAHVSMMSDPLGVRGMVRVFWTLAYEMTFYLIVAGLFAWRLHRHTGWWAAGLALLALAGPELPDGLFAAHLTIAATGLLVLMVAAVAAGMTGRHRLAGLFGLAFVLVPIVNAHPGRGSTVVASWEGVLLLAVMFAGTVVYRTQHRQLGRWAAGLSLLVVVDCLVGAHAAYGNGPVWVATVGAVGLTFAGAFALRRRSVPRVLTWLGTISYSLYLLHVPVLGQLTRLVPHVADRPVGERIGFGLVFLVISGAVAALSQRWIELPAQDFGRRILRRRRARITTQRAVPGTGRGENAPRSV